MILLSREELAWAAGLFDGEGNSHFCITNQSRGYKTPMIGINISNTYLPLLKKFQQVTGGLGHIYVLRPHSFKTHWKPAWQFRTGKFEHAQAIMSLIWPWLSNQKKAQFIAAKTNYHDLVKG